MITIDEKIDFFRKIILDNIEKDYNELKKSLDKKLESERKKNEVDAKNKSQNYLKQFVAKAEEERKAKVLEAKKEKKERILERKNRLIEKVYESVLDKCTEFTDTKQYDQVINRLIEQVKDELEDFGSLKIILIKKDFERKEVFKEIIKRNLEIEQIEFIQSNKDFKGGLLILNGDETVQIDLSLLAIVSRNKLFIGNEVQKLLEENGGLDE